MIKMWNILSLQKQNMILFSNLMKTPQLLWLEQGLYRKRYPGADPGFQVREGAHLKKLRRAEGGAKSFGVFRVKNHDFTPKNHIFPILGPPGSAPGII